jgi:hypothetical protein
MYTGRYTSREDQQQALKRSIFDTMQTGRASTNDHASRTTQGQESPSKVAQRHAIQFHTPHHSNSFEFPNRSPQPIEVKRPSSMHFGTDRAHAGKAPRQASRQGSFSAPDSPPESLCTSLITFPSRSPQPIKVKMAQQCALWYKPD